MRTPTMACMSATWKPIELTNSGMVSPNTRTRSATAE